MDDPVAEISEAIDACAAAPTPDAQITAFKRYFLVESSFLHPLCYVPTGPDSRATIIRIYFFYRAVIPITEFEIKYVAFDEKVKGISGRLFVDLVQRPWVRGVTWMTGGWRPALPMHIIFDLRVEEGRWMIEAQEDVVQPMSALLAVTPLRPIGFSIYSLFRVLGLLSGWILRLLGIWKPNDQPALEIRHGHIDKTR